MVIRNIFTKTKIGSSQDNVAKNYKKNARFPKRFAKKEKVYESLFF